MNPICSISQNSTIFVWTFHPKSKLARHPDRRHVIRVAAPYRQSIALLASLDQVGAGEMGAYNLK
jgi:hypothetical protein